MENKRYTFKGKIIKDIFKSDSFSVYAVEINSLEYPDIKRNKYGNVSISGELYDLSYNVEYTITAEETNTKYGVGYKVVNISRDIPTTKEEVLAFLREILTPNQAETLVQNYPDIIDKVKNGNTDDIDLSKLKGIGEKTLEKIKDKIITNYHLMELVVEFKNILSMSILKKIYDKYSSVELLRKKLQTKPYTTLTNISGIGFKTADAIVLQLQKENVVDFGFDIKTSSDRCLACLLYLLSENENEGHTKMNLQELRSQCLKLVPACADHFVDVIKDDSIYYNKETMNVALKKTYECEKYICDNMIDRLSVKNEWDFDIEKYKSFEGLNLSDEQFLLLDAVCKNQVVILTAPAGSGKSYSTKALVNMLKGNKKSFILAAPTGRASQKMSEYCGEQANTVHRTLNFNPDGGFKYNKDNQLIADVVILDEVGMIDVFLFKHLLEAIKKDTKIVLIGDKFQLSSIMAGCLLRDLCDSKRFKHITLNKIFRLGTGGALTACTYVRQGKKFIDKNAFIQIGEDKSYSFIPCTKSNINDMIIKLYKKLLETNKASEITVISCYNVGENGCFNLNKLLQPIANKNSINNNRKLIVKQNKNIVEFYEGDSIVQCVNNYHSNIYGTNEETLITNGTLGVIKKIMPDKKLIIIDFEGINIIYTLDELQMIKHSFAMSVHRMQGGQNKNIIFCCPSSHLYFLNNSLIYTALSRAEKNIYHFSDVKTFNIAINKHESVNRNTFLGDLLKY